MRKDARYKILSTNKVSFIDLLNIELSFQHKPNLIDTFLFLKNDYGDIEQLIVNFSQWVPKRIYFEGHSILVLVVEKALEAIYHKKKKSEIHQPHHYLFLFIKTLLEGAKHTCNFIIMNKKTLEKWHLLKQEAIFLWFWRNDLEQLIIRQSTVSKNKLTQVIYEKIIPLNLQKIMKIFDYEKCLLADDLDDFN